MSIYYKDNPQYLELAIKSMLEQTVKPDQFVLVIDGEITYELQQVVDKYADVVCKEDDSWEDVKGDEFFYVIGIGNNAGLANAMNVGLRFCRNNLVARMDADDIALPDRCKKELELFEQYDELAICGCNIDEFYSEDLITETSRKVPGDYEGIVKFSKRRQPFNHPTVIFKKDVIQELGGYPKLRRKEDFDLFSRLITAGYYARNVEESLYLYRANENNYKRRKSIMNLKAAIAVYKMHLKRHGCSIVDFIIISSAEILFFIMPLGLMKIVSDKLLRK